MRHGIQKAEVVPVKLRDADLLGWLVRVVIVYRGTNRLKLRIKPRFRKLASFKKPQHAAVKTRWRIAPAEFVKQRTRAFVAKPAVADASAVSIALLIFFDGIDFLNQLAAALASIFV